MIPATISGTKRYCVFRTIPQPDGKLKKIPLTPRGDPALVNRDHSWCTLREAQLAIAYGVGNYPAIALGEGFPLGCVDLDGCFDAEGKLSPLAAEVLALVGETYVERSVSGKGLHIYFWANDREVPVNPTPGIEVYGNSPGGRWIILTGIQYGACPDINTLPAALEDYILAFAPAAQTMLPAMRNTGEKIPQDEAIRRFEGFEKKHGRVMQGARNSTLFALAMMLRDFGLTATEMEKILWGFSNEHFQPPYNPAHLDDRTEVFSIAKRCGI